MKVTVDSRNPVDANADLLAILLAEQSKSRRRVPPRLAAIDRALGGAITRVMDSGDFRGKRDQTCTLYPPKSTSLKATRILLIGLGDAEGIEPETLRAAAGRAIQQASSRSARRVALLVPLIRKSSADQIGQTLAEGAVLAAYRFDRYQTQNRDSQPAVQSLSIKIERSEDLRDARAGAARGLVLAESQNLARDLSNEPGNALPPLELARRAVKMAKEVGLKAKVMRVPELRRRKMGAILAVGEGSVNPPCLIVLEHVPSKRGSKRTQKSPSICWVGKGITFDSGGISIKPSAAMDEMKHDMSGAAAVVGAMRACALLDVPRHVVGIIAAAENMPSGTAYRPGDVVTSLSGKTIEVLNTDAEGRVVLADALHYARTEYDPVAMVDLATLTGACVVALGKWATGLFTNDDELSNRIQLAAAETGERVWPMPLFDEHRKAVKSQIADVKNTGGRDAGASTAAAFLANFVGKTPWVHLDIAGTGWTNKGGPYQRSGGTGVGVRLLLETLRQWGD
ncbi:leucyl aminopeptidase [Myxococcota bacterium]|nr:leucyl aminopeptidase [Myxococcota bacterium]